MKEYSWQMVSQAGHDEWTVFCESQKEAEDLAIKEWRHLTNWERTNHYVCACYGPIDNEGEGVEVTLEFGERRF